MIKIFSSISEAMAAHPNSYVSFAKIGRCMVCGETQDLRCGACFDCSSLVDGTPIKGGHRLWQKDKPDNTWYSGEL